MPPSQEKQGQQNRMSQLRGLSPSQNPRRRADPEPATPSKKPKPTAEASDAVPPDVRDRIDSPPPSPPAEKPKKKSGWNPFGR